jgi:tetratricopeptide (TPR) repeat protein
MMTAEINVFIDDGAAHVKWLLEGEVDEYDEKGFPIRKDVTANEIAAALNGLMAALEAAGDFPGSAEHQTSLWMEYPDGADGLLAFFSLGQRFQEFAANPASVPLRPGAMKWTKNQLLERSRDLLRQLVTLHAKDDLADDAAFSLTNVFFDLKDYASVVTTAGNAAATFKKSSFLNNFHYMTALGRFWQYQFPEALAAAAPVAAGSSEDAPNARYITAQIHHAQGKAGEAIRWYEKVKDEFDDQSEILWTKLDEKNILFVAKIPLIDMYRVYDIDGDDFEASRGDSTTLGGFIVEQMGRIPKRGETWQFGSFEFTIESADNRKISRVKVKRYV